MNVEETGTYYLLTRDDDAREAGEYTVSLTVSGGGLTIASGDEGGEILNGETKGGSIPNGDIDSWTFTAKANDYITASVGDKTNNDFSPYIALVSPSGVSLVNDWGYTGALIYISVTEDGTYTLVIRDNDARDAGEFNLSLAVSGGGLTITSGDEGGNVTKGTAVTGKIEFGDIDPWLFTVNKGDLIEFTITETAKTDFSPYFCILTPSGKILKDNWSYTQAELSVTTNETGIHTLIVRDNDARDAGEYSLLWK